MENGGACSVSGCVKARRGNQVYCDSHYRRNLKYGNPLASGAGRWVASNEDRFWAKVNKQGGVPPKPYRWEESMGECWLWLDKISEFTDGYGVMLINESAWGVGYFYATGEPGPQSVAKARKAHRVSWRIKHGRWPTLYLDHLCRVRECVNPEHLEEVTHAENVRRSPLVNKTHCPRGHEYTPENSYFIPSTGGKMCRTCERARSKTRTRSKKH